MDVDIFESFAFLVTYAHHRSVRQIAEMIRDCIRMRLSVPFPLSVGIAIESVGGQPCSWRKGFHPFEFESLETVAREVARIAEQRCKGQPAIEVRLTVAPYHRTERPVAD